MMDEVKIVSELAELRTEVFNLKEEVPALRQAKHEINAMKQTFDHIIVPIKSNMDEIITTLKELQKWRFIVVGGGIASMFFFAIGWAVVLIKLNSLIH